VDAQDRNSPDPAEVDGLLDAAAYQAHCEARLGSIFYGGNTMFMPHTEADREAMLKTIGVKRSRTCLATFRTKQRFPGRPSTRIDRDGDLAELQELAWANSTARGWPVSSALACITITSPRQSIAARRGEFIPLTPLPAGDFARHYRPSSNIRS
jgi:hypothetical protein